MLLWSVVAFAACASEDAASSPVAESGAPAARIVCDGTTTVIETPVVETTPKGVVFDVEVPKGSNFGFVVKEAGQGDNAEAGPFVWVVPPGIAHLRCLGPDQDSEIGDVSTYETIRIVDPDRIYKSTELGCSDGLSYFMSDGAAGLGEPEEQALERLDGLRSDDLVERAAYPASRYEATVRVVRDGTVVATLEFEGRGQDWAFTGFSSCPGTELSA